MLSQRIRKLWAHISLYLVSIPPILAVVNTNIKVRKTKGLLCIEYCPFLSTISRSCSNILCVFILKKIFSFKEACRKYTALYITAERLPQVDQIPQI